MPVRIRPKDELAGIEAFAPRAEGSDDDPFVKAFAPDRRRPAAGGRGAARAGLVAAVVVLLAGLVSLVAVGDDDGDLATTRPTIPPASTSTSIHRVTTSSSTRPTVTFGTPTTPSTATGFAAGTGSTFVPTTSHLVPTTSSLPPPTRPPGNQPLEISFALEPAQPVAGQPVRVTITFVDADAPPSSNCRQIEFDAGPTYADPCAAPTCDAHGGAAGGGQGGEGVAVVIEHVWSEPGSYRIAAHGESLQPYCSDRFGSERTEIVTVTVAAPVSRAGVPSR